MLAERNKLQITSSFVLRELETKIVKEKFKSLDKSLLFDNETLDINFLKSLHEYLFEDIYYPSRLTIRSVYNKEDLLSVNGILQNIIFLAEERLLDIKYLKDTMYTLWEYQLFRDGNNRTLWAYSKIFINYYNLPIELAPFKENSYGHFDMVPKDTSRAIQKTKVEYTNEVNHY